MKVPVHGRIWGEAEHERLMQVVLSDWYTAGDACKEFARKLSGYCQKRDVTLTNSGSSANLLAVTALTQPELGDRAILPGDEVITAALGFPTTLNPILQNGAVPVLVDVDLPGLVPSVDRVAAAITERTKAVVLAHTLGYPLPMRELSALCKQRGLWLIADCADALGSPGIMDGADLSTLSFYPAHQIAVGEGGAVLTDNLKLGKILRSLRDWGRDCWCAPGTDNTCGVRFAGGRDHKYTYSHIGYHLAMTEFEGAIGAAQMDRLPGFVRLRIYNHAYLYDGLDAAGMDKYFILPPFDAPWVSWFGFTLLCVPPVNRDKLACYLEDHGIQTRRVFGGNLLRQPAYASANIVVNEPLLNTDYVDGCGLWVGCWPGLSSEQLSYTVDTIVAYCEGL